MHSPKELCADSHAQEKNEILNSSLKRCLLILFLPLFLSLCLSSFIGIADMYLAGQLGSKAQAAVGIGDQIIFLVIVCGTALCTAASTYISQACGAGNKHAALLFARDSLFIGLIFGTIATLLGFLYTETIVDIFQPSAAIKSLAIPYVQFSSLANAPFIISLCQTSIFRAFAKPSYAVLIWLITSLITIAGSFYGFYCLPAPWSQSLEVLGAAWTIGASIGMLCGFVLMQQAGICLFAKKNLILEGTKTRLLLLFQTACPVVFSELAAIISQFFIYRLLAGFNDSAQMQAAWTIRMRLEETVALIPLLALGMSTAVIVGHNIGAGRNLEAKNKTIKITAVSTGVMFLIGLFISAGAEPIARLFSNDQATVEATRALLSSAVILLPCTALCSVLNSALEGAGLTLSPMCINLGGLFVGRTGLSYLLAITAGFALNGIIAAAYISAAAMVAVSIGCFNLQLKRQKYT